MLFVGRITRQKGILHLANAIRHMSRDFQIVLCAGAPDTPEIAAEMRRKVDEAIGRRFTCREAAILVGFPPDYPFAGGSNATFKQAGNAVAPVMASTWAGITPA